MKRNLVTLKQIEYPKEPLCFLDFENIFVFFFSFQRKCRTIFPFFNFRLVRLVIWSGNSGVITIYQSQLSIGQLGKTCTNALLRLSSLHSSANDTAQDVCYIYFPGGV